MVFTFQKSKMIGFIQNLAREALSRRDYISMKTWSELRQKAEYACEIQESENHRMSVLFKQGRFYGYDSRTERSGTQGIPESYYFHHLTTAVGTEPHLFIMRSVGAYDARTAPKEYFSYSGINEMPAKDIIADIDNQIKTCPKVKLNPVLPLWAQAVGLKSVDFAALVR